MFESRNFRRHLQLILAAILPVLVALLIGQMATYPYLTWHASLNKPAFNPPNLVFGPVWITLYGLMAFACWRVLQKPKNPAGRNFALVLFFAQLILNASWPWMFFAAHSPLLGVINIVPQFAIVIATMLTFFDLDRPAGLALIPLMLWVAFSTALNTAIWTLN